MKKDDTIRSDHYARDLQQQDRKFWRNAFLIYALIEIIIILIQNFITRSQCAVCVLPFGFYLVNWIQNLVFTGLLWLCLNRSYYLKLWKTIPVNVILFAVYYFLWLAALYVILNSKVDFLVWDRAPYKAFKWFVYGSWADIGKYVLKASAFYMLKFYLEYRKSEQQRVRLAVINKEMQLNLLKQQLSPHFYFNTLNNLYGLARTNSEKLASALGQLSNIMQYVIIDCNQPKVKLRDEIKFLESYIALEKLRYEPGTVIEMKIREEENAKIKVNDQQILPLLLIQFVENAFKHGMKEKSTKNWMKVDLDINGQEIVFKVENSFYEAAVTSGIGISSVRHILDLQYAGKYELEMEHVDNRFSVILKLNLS